MRRILAKSIVVILIRLAGNVSFRHMLNYEVGKIIRVTTSYSRLYRFNSSKTIYDNFQFCCLAKQIDYNYFSLWNLIWFVCVCVLLKKYYSWSWQNNKIKRCGWDLNKRRRCSVFFKINILTNPGSKGTLGEIFL